MSQLAAGLFLYNHTQFTHLVLSSVNDHNQWHAFVLKVYYSYMQVPYFMNIHDESMYPVYNLVDLLLTWECQSVACFH